MKKLMIFLAAALTLTSVFADRGYGRGYGHDRGYDRPIIVRPEIPTVPTSCTYNLVRRNGNFLMDFTRYSCAAAYDACDYERMVRPNSRRLQCVQAYSRPTPPPRRVSCEYRIQDGRRAGRDVFSSSGVFACDEAQAQCERVLRVKRQRGEVSRIAQCVKIGGNNPPPRRVFNAQCTAQQFFSSNRGNNPTSNYFYGNGTGYSREDARRNACADAMSQCQSVSSGRFYCVELN